MFTKPGASAPGFFFPGIRVPGGKKVQTTERTKGRDPRDQLLAATFGARPGYRDMNSFLKIFLLVLAAIIAVKLVPVTLALGAVLGLLVVGLLLCGLSLVAVVAVAALALAAVLAPVWIPALVILGLIALVKRFGSRPAPA